jgi:Flp pilus assembly protein TadB
MFRFLFGILIVQIATVALVMLAPDDLHGLAWFRLIIPLLVVGSFAAFWFGSIAKHHSKDEVYQVKEQHAQEREKIQINAERAKTRLVKKTQQQIAREAKITHSKANFKVGAAFAAAIGAGALMLLTELLTLGLLTITTAGGALGGYIMRARREKIDRKYKRLADGNDNKVKVIENKK